MSLQYLLYQLHFRRRDMEIGLTKKTNENVQISCRQIHVLVNLCSIYFERQLYEVLKQNKIMSRPAGKISLIKSLSYQGISNSSKNNVQFLDPPFFIGKYYTIFLLQNPQLCQKISVKIVPLNECVLNELKQITTTKQYTIFKYFAKNNYLIDGHKFGGLFLVYELDPDKNHAKYLIFNGKFNENHMTRLADISKKIGLYVQIGQQNSVKITQIQRTDNKKRVRPKDVDLKHHKEIDDKDSQRIGGNKKIKEEGKIFNEEQDVKIKTDFNSNEKQDKIEELNAQRQNLKQ